MFIIYNYSFLKDNERIYWNVLLKIEYPLKRLYPLDVVFLTCQNYTFHNSIRLSTVTISPHVNSALKISKWFDIRIKGLSN